MNEDGRKFESSPPDKVSRRKYAKAPLQQRPLCADIAQIDKDILKLLIKRNELMLKLRRSGKIEAADEKFLREAWQRQVSRVSHDAELSGRFFSLMQNVTFLPRPTANGADSVSSVPGSQRREGFNLAPARQPVTFSMTAPLDGNLTCAWLYLASASGMPIRLEPCLQSDPVIDCIKALVQMGGAISRDGEAITVREFAPLGYPDKIVHAGDNLYNLCLFIAHYIGRPSRVKFTGGTTLKLADISPLTRILPTLGARLTHIVPKSNGLPARMESSGALPPSMLFAPELPAQFAEALLLASSFYEKPFALDLSPHPQKAAIMSHTLPILEQVGASFVVDGNAVNLQPASLSLPGQPQLSLEPDLAANLLALTEPLGGTAKLIGQWPDWPETNSLWTVLNIAGLQWQKDTHTLQVINKKPLVQLNFEAVLPEILQGAQTSFPLFLALAACAALNGGTIYLPDILIKNDEALDFLHTAGLDCGPDNKLELKQNFQDNTPWNAPTPNWAMALAITACARKEKQRFQLGNPGIMTELWPAFWSFYNSLPNPAPKKTQTIPEAPTKMRRRIITNAVAQIPDAQEEDI